MNDKPGRAPTATQRHSGRGAKWLLFPLAALLLAGLWALWRNAEPASEPEAAAAQHTTPRHRERGSLLTGDPGDAHHAGEQAGKGEQGPALARVVAAPGAHAGSIEGEVRSSADGKPIAHAELTFEKDGVLVSELTSADGRYHFAPQQPGSWRLSTLSADGFLPFAPAWGQNTVRFEVLPGKRIAGATLFLEPATDYLGEVRGPDEKPVSGAEVRLFAPATDAALMPLHDVFHSDARGEFHFRAPRDAVLEARHPRLGRGRARIDFAEEVSAHVVIRLSGTREVLSKALDISGHVLDREGQAVEGAVVTAEPTAPPEGHEPGLPVFATSDEEGFFRLTPVDPGRYNVLASHGELAPDSVDDVPAGSHDVRLELGSGGRVVGTVRSREGAPIPSFTVHVWQKLGPIATRLVRSLAVLDAEGRFAVQGLPASPLLLGVEAQGHAPSADLPFSAQESGPPATLQVVLDRGFRLAGVVLDAASKSPLGGARVTLEGRGNTEAEPTRSTTQSDARGSFVIDGVNAGQVSLFVAARDHHARILGGIAVPSAAPVTVELRATERDEKPKLELAGLGLVLSARDDALVVLDMAPKGGGAEAGMQVGDGIVAVAGTPVSELGFAGAIAQLRGPENTSIVLSVRRKQGTEPVDMVVFLRLVRM
jgi:hypothetical protein